MKSSVYFNLSLFCLLLAGTVFTLPASVAATPSIVTVLPFDIHADKNINYVKKGISRMLYSRLSWPDKVKVIPPGKTASLTKGHENLPPKEKIQTVAAQTESQYVITGSITQFDGFFSIDAKIFDIPKERYMGFSQISENPDDLIAKVDRIAAAVNQKVFERTTVTWQEMKKEGRQKLAEFKRKHPEHLMKLPPGMHQSNE
ncbi:MAG: hypothetical protein MI802_14910, partial [Desulfobacterales bacterium]|nr:hypothetical protein [Desulfobacterales bacterium]